MIEAKVIEPSMVRWNDVTGLSRYRSEWLPDAWHERLLYLAGVCAGLNPERSAELRTAAKAMIVR